MRFQVFTLAAAGIWSALSFPASAAVLTASFRAVPIIVRSDLSASEAAESRVIELPLRLRNLTELQNRVARGDVLTAEELAARYLPLADDQGKVETWARGQGLQVLPGRHVLSVFAAAPVSRLASAFGVKFARVARGGQEYTSAVTAPLVPDDVSSLIIGVGGLQPHLSHLVRFDSPGGAAPYHPAQILAAYNGASTGLTGAGQTIAIVAGTYPAAADLTTFFSSPGINRTAPLPVNVPVGSGPPQGSASGESSLDAEWAGAIAPGAKLRIYGLNVLNTVTLDQACSQIYNDASADATLRIVSMSFGSVEGGNSPATLQASTQYFTMLSALGVTCFGASGDAGSQPGVLGGGAPSNEPGFPSGVSYPASDPNVVSVGGTTLNLDSSGSVLTESAWSSSGGGNSTAFARGAWQTGAGVINGTRRLVPDVAAVADPAAGAAIFYNGQWSSSAGTSLACPVWAGIGALINQARLANGLQTLGSAAPKLYPLIGTAAFWDINVGSNGLFSSGAGFDLTTGLGSPNIAQLVAALGSAAPPAAPAAPVVVNRPGTQQAVAGSPIQLSVVASAAGTMTYAWQRRPAGSGLWSNVAASGPYGAVVTPILTINPVSAAMNGDAFRCQVTTSGGTTVGPAMVLAVELPAVVTTFAGKAGTAGSTDGIGSAARLNAPFGAAVDASGNIFVADSGNAVIREIAPDGTVSTVAGTAGATGSADGSGAAARFNRPSALAFDGAGNLFVSDTGNNTIRRIAPASGFAVTTVAGAAFSSPRGIAFDASGNLYIADGGSFTIRRMTPAGVVSVFSGQTGVAGTADGSSSVASFTGPRGLAFDRAGNLYVADTTGSALRRVAADGSVTTVAGTGGFSGSEPGSSDVSRVQSPYGVASDAAGNIFFSDNMNSAIQVLSPAGVVSSVAGLPGSPGTSDGTGVSARFNAPLGIAVDGSGNVYVADSGNNTIRKLAIAPTVYVPPQTQSAPVGGSVTLTVAATGSGLTYQWSYNGAAISGATSSTLVISGLQASSAGQYAVTVHNAAGSVTTAAATLSVTAATTPTIHLVNLSTKAHTDVGAAGLTLGFSAGGSNSATKTLLLRGVGPKLADFGVPGVLAAPVLTFYNSAGAAIATNSAWGTPAYPGAFGATALQAAFSATGAFMLPVGSLDTAMLYAVSSGSATLGVSGAGGTAGIALAEIYDTDTAATPPILLENLSARAVAGAGSGNGVTAGFVLSGSGKATLLIRGIGPALTGFSVTGALAQTSLTVYDQPGATIASNSGWSTPPTPGSSTVGATVLPATAAVMNSVYAFSLAPGSADSAVVVTLPSGLYTAEVSGAGGSTGVALVEIYLVSTQ